jgi:secondary thiamine-phosphate synthase enzyme
LEDAPENTATRPQSDTTVLASSAGALTEVLHFKTSQGEQFVDLTDDVRECVYRAGVRHGQVTVSSPHTTGTITVNEVERGFHNDFRRAVEALVPKDAYYEHDDHELRTENLQEDEFLNGHAHVRHALVGSPTVTFPVVDCEVVLGQWQRILYLELDQARSRRVILHVQGVL